jgi:hypothetical protein
VRGRPGPSYTAGKGKRVGEFTAGRGEQEVKRSGSRTRHRRSSGRTEKKAGDQELLGWELPPASREGSELAWPGKSELRGKAGSWASSELGELGAMGAWSGEDHSAQGNSASQGAAR